MLKLEAITKDAQIAGLDPNGIVRVVSVEPVGMDVVGQLAEQMALRTNQARLGWVLPMPVADSNAQPAPHNGLPMFRVTCCAPCDSENSPAAVLQE